MSALPPSTAQSHHTNAHLTTNYHHREVQNLAWCLTSPSIIGDAKNHDIYTLAPSQSLRQLLLELDQDPSDLIDWLNAAPSPRLGLMFERYWQYYWMRDTKNAEWLFNRQCHQRGRTLGELDALRWSPTASTLDHYELAVKFYLQRPRPTPLSLAAPQLQLEPSQWVGPNAIDWLHKKYQHMCDQQLSCLSPETINDWTPWSIEQKNLRLRTHMIFKGRLFHQLHSEHPALLQPYIDPQHSSGYWLTLQQWHQLSGRCHWLILSKSEWLAPLWGESGHGVMPPQQMGKVLARNLDLHDTPIQVISLNEGSSYWTEAERFFVVSQQWLNRFQG